MPNVSKVCPQCREPFIGRSNQKFCKPKCKDEYNNARKSEPRREALVDQEGICGVPTCNERALFFEPDLGYVLCGFHHSDYCKYRRIKASELTELERLIQEQTREIELEEKGIFDTRIGRYYSNYFHVSFETIQVVDEVDPIEELIDRIDRERAQGAGRDYLPQAA